MIHFASSNIVRQSIVTVSFRQALRTPVSSSERLIHVVTLHNDTHVQPPIYTFYQTANACARLLQSTVEIEITFTMREDLACTQKLKVARFIFHVQSELKVDNKKQKIKITAHKSEGL